MINFTPNNNFKYYMYFISERMNIFWNKYESKELPYTNDIILQQHKFTNVYRVLDRSSQYLLKNVIYNGKKYSPEDMIFRILVYKHFNLPSTWEILIKEFGDIDLNLGLDSIEKFLLSHQNICKDFTPYSNAYMLTAGFLVGVNGKYVHLKGNGWRKYQYYFYIFKKEIFESLLIYDILDSRSFKNLFDNVSRITSFADFLSYQMAQDFNYTDLFNFDDNEFCSAGGGTIRGIERCFDIKGKIDYGNIVKWVQNNFKQLCEDYGIDFKSIPNWDPKVPDLSNCFCETDKYLRGMGIITEGKDIEGKRIKNKFIENTEKMKFVFPPKWNINNF